MSGDRSPMVLRPSVPPFLWVSGAIWLGIAVAEQNSWSRYAGASASGGWLSALVAAVVLLLLSRRRVAVMVALGLACGVVIGSLYWSHYRAEVSRLENLGEADWVADCPQDASAGQFGSRSTAVLVSHSRGARISCLWPEGAQPPELGQRVALRGSLIGPQPDDRGRRAHRSGTLGAVSPSMVEARGWSPNLSGAVGPTRLAAVQFLDQVPGPGGALLSGIVVGDRRRLQGTQAEEDFRITGLTHLVAISGGHLVVVAGVIAWGMSRLGIKRSNIALVVLLALAAYVAATGMQSSAVRAWIMTAVVALALSAGRRADPLAGLGAALAVSVATDPTAAFDVGLQLSVAAVGGLLLFSRWAEAWVTVSAPPAFRAVAGPLALTLTAQVATTPVSATTFGVVSLIAPVANLLVGPIVTVVLFAGLLGVSLSGILPSVARAVVFAAGAAGSLGADIAARLAAVPGAAVAFDEAALASVCCIVCAAALWIWWPQPVRSRARLLLPLLLAVWVSVAVGLPGSGGDGLLMCDVGQGDMVLVRDGRSATLVDTGPSAKSAVAAVARAGVRRVDAIVLTHMHADHTGGLEGLGGLVSASRVLVARGGEKSDIGVPRGCGDVAGVRSGDVITVGGYRMRVLWPKADVPDAAENSASVVLLVEAPGFTALLTGDAEDDVLSRLIAEGAVGDIDVLKVGHHGSDGSVSDETLRVLRPEVVLISVGAGNRYGHPAQTTLESAQRAGARVFRTDQGGDISVIVDRNGYRIEAQKDGTSAAACGTLFGAALRRIPSDTAHEGTDEPQGHRPQVRLSHLWYGGAPSRAGLAAPEGFRWRGG